MARVSRRASFTIAEQVVQAGSRATIDLPVAPLYTHTPLTMPVQVVHGHRDGPTLFVSGVIHGDELNGMEIIRRLLRHTALKHLRGTLMAIPVVNVHGLIHRDRYMPDRRDLNRSFPGSERGSVAARLAHLFMHEVVARCDYGIDLHTAGTHRVNLPQVRADLDDEETVRLARAFGAPVLLNSQLRDGSMRQVAEDVGCKVLLYEAGEALRFDEVAIRAGVAGVLGVMRALGMLVAGRTHRPPADPVVARSSQWVRAEQSGIVRLVVPLGSRVRKGQTLAYIADPFGESETAALAPVSGIVIGRSTLPLANEGEALFHIARFEDVRGAEEQVTLFQEALDPAQTTAMPYDEPSIL